MMLVLERQKRESASEYVKRVLEYNIVHMKLLPGEQLQEKVLAEQLSVSRTPIRERAAFRASMCRRTRRPVA